jgi:hypothetical protein
MVLILDVKLRRVGQKPGHVNSAGRYESATIPRQRKMIRAGSLADNHRNHRTQPVMRNVINLTPKKLPQLCGSFNL